MEKIQKILDDHVYSNNIPGISISVTNDENTLSLQSGNTSIQSKKPLSKDDCFQIGSLTKMFIATTILTLKDRGDLHLDQYAVDFLKDTPVPATITIRQLLQHRSGLEDYIIQEHNEKALVAWGLTDVKLPPEFLVQKAVDATDNDQSDDCYAYSNTNYIILGMIIEKITGRSVSEVLDSLFTQPLGLKNTSLPQAPVSLSTNGHSRLTDDLSEETGELKELSVYNPSVPWTAGAMTSTPEEINMWLHALMTGKLLKDSSLKEMIDFSFTSEETEKYGLGITQFHVADEVCAIGHHGGIQGYESLALYFPEENLYLTVLINQMPSGIGDIVEELYNALVTKEQAQS
ncbi:serine hydrolase domain-containing protein [Halobacillus salinus]|uniref:serine hydrolase domain-containing protein n=1 Tax=Halobacillus salinus TaxID=192814 RepID=UPI0009A6E078|nr:serine hydrolase domain-containing protein [Halobacillus salinus]